MEITINKFGIPKTAKSGDLVYGILLNGYIRWLNIQSGPHGPYFKASYTKWR
jgi:hypothetical protein